MSHQKKIASAAEEELQGYGSNGGGGGRDRSSAVTVVIREYDEERHKVGLERMESQCGVTSSNNGQQQKKQKKNKKKKKKTATLVTDLLGDPLCRVRHFSLHLMLVAEWGEGGEVVGVIRGCIKTVTLTQLGSSSSSPLSSTSSEYVKVANVLGLRVSPSHRRHGIATRLVQAVEEWSKRNGADYACMATDSTNLPSLSLFTTKCNYIKFRTPTLLVQPVHAHAKPTGSRSSILRIPLRLAESIYRQVFAESDFFPKDIDTILGHTLNLGTFMALPKDSMSVDHPPWNLDELGTALPPSFAILSVWNTKEVFKLQVKGVSGLMRACCAGSRVVDSCMPWLRIPSVPNVFEQFGVYFLYGLHMRGNDGPRLMKSLCAFAHNMAKNDVGCGALVAEVGARDPVKAAIPHWRRFSWSEDIWCIKLLNEEIIQNYGDWDWIDHKLQPQSPVLFVDPRDI